MKKTILNIVILLIANSLAAQPLNLSLQKCCEMALESNQDLKIANYQNQQAKMEKKFAASNYFPKVSASAGYGYLNGNLNMVLPEFNLDMQIMIYHPVYGPVPVSVKDMIPKDINLNLNTDLYTVGAMLQQPVYAGGKIVAGNKMAKTGIAITEENINMVRMATIAEVKKAYWTYYSVKDKINLLKQYESLLDTLTVMVNGMIVAKMATDNELLKIETRKSNIQYQMQKVMNGLELCRMQLCRIIGVDMNTEIVLTDNILEENIQSLTYGFDVSARPEFKILQKQVELKSLNVKMVRGDYLPTIGLVANYNYLGRLNLSGIAMNMKRPMFMAMAALSIPITDWAGGSRKIKSAKIARDIQQTELEKNSKLLNIEANYAERNLQDAFLLISTAETGLAQAKANLEHSRNKFEMGMGTLLDVLDAQTQWQEAQSNYLDACAQYKISEVEYLRVSGKL